MKFFILFAFVAVMAVEAFGPGEMEGGPMMPDNYETEMESMEGVLDPESAESGESEEDCDRMRRNPHCMALMIPAAYLNMIRTESLLVQSASPEAVRVVARSRLRFAHRAIKTVRALLATDDRLDEHLKMLADHLPPMIRDHLKYVDGDVVLHALEQGETMLRHFHRRAAHVPGPILKMMMTRVLRHQEMGWRMIAHGMAVELHCRP